ncbi:MAG: RNA 2',3'-cyclic phosphodiesterase [Candidatus Altiarchaeota archaeon]|nr:RNA 2',3'-cyclic phosphodiesterase [Candidatus Altiarchaeota archaeon]
MNKRLFIAIPLPYRFHETVADLQDRINGFGKLKPVKPENVHLTLKFLGNVKGERIQEIEDRLSFIREIHSFNISVCGLGAFPKNKSPRVIWVGVGDGFDEIKNLQGKIDSSLEGAGFDRDMRFHPHYTLARVKFLNNKAGLMDFIRGKRLLAFGEHSVERVVLMESRLAPKGSEYSVVREFRLKR